LPTPALEEKRGRAGIEAGEFLERLVSVTLEALGKPKAEWDETYYRDPQDEAFVSSLASQVPTLSCKGVEDDHVILEGLPQVVVTADRWILVGPWRSFFIEKLNLVVLSCEAVLYGKWETPLEVHVQLPTHRGRHLAVDAYAHVWFRPAEAEAFERALGREHYILLSARMLSCASGL